LGSSPRTPTRQPTSYLANLGQPEFDGLGFGAGHGLDEAEQGFGGDYAGES